MLFRSENGWHRGPAELAAYGRVTRSLGDPAAECARRQRLIFASHRDATNPALRASLTAALAGRGVPNEQLSRPAYRERMRGSCFVMSPPGNGVDCHRTWEAIALGAVPVVLRSALASTLVDAAPIVAVTSWEEVLDLTEAELRALYCEVRSRPPGAATMAYWSVRLGLEVTTNEIGRAHV